MNQRIFDSNKIEDNNVFNPAQNMYIEASAGTGKTYTIQQVVARLVKDGVKLSSILIVTYTEKAAGELKDRIRKKIQEVLTNKCIIKDVSEPLTDEQLGNFETAIREIDGAQIFTIHSFCQKTLRTYAYDALRPFDMQLIDDKAVRELIHRKIRDEWPSNPEFLKIIDSGALTENVDAETDDLNKTLDKIENILVNAIPKYYLDIDGNENENIVQLVEPKFPSEDDQKYGTIKSFEDLKKLPEFIVSFDILSKEVYSSLKTSKSGSNTIAKLVGCIKSWECPSVLVNGNSFREYNAELGWPSDLVKSYNWIKELSTTLQKYKNYDYNNEYRKSLLNSFLYKELKNNIYQEWRKWKTEHKYESYQDMIHAVHHAVELDKDSTLVDQLRKDYTYGIIDEFQDTNQLQWDIFKAIFIGNETHPLKDTKHSLLVVGDPKQSIYSFQGADIKVYNHATREIIRNGSSLKNNFRSTEAMIRACNHLFDTDRGSEFFTDGDLLFSEKEGAYSGYPSSSDNPALRDKTTTQFDGEDTQPIWISPDNITKEKFAAFAAERIVECCSKPDGKKTRLQVFTSKDIPDQRRDVTFADFAILARARSEFEQIEGELKRLGIPFVRYKDDNLFNSRECMQWMALFNAIDADDFASGNRRLLNEALMTDFFELDDDGIGDGDGSKSNSFELESKLPRIVKTNVNKIYQVCDKKFDDPTCTVRKQLAEYHALARKFRWAELLECIYHLSQLETRIADDLSKLQSLAKFQQIGNYCIEYLYTHRCTIQELVKHLDNLRKGEEKTSDKNGELVGRNTDFKAVQLMTIHASKGLEFPVVIVVGGFNSYNKFDAVPYSYHMEDGKKKLGFDDFGKDAKKQEALEEWKRLFYVAYTRASALLILPRCNASSDTSFLTNSIHSFVERSPDDCKVWESVDDETEADARDAISMKIKETVKNIIKSQQETMDLDDVDQNSAIIELQDSLIKKSLLQHSYSSLTAKMKHKDIDVSPGVTDGMGKNTDAASDGEDSEVSDVIHESKRERYAFYDAIHIYDDGMYQSGKDVLLDSDYPKGKQLGNAIHEVFENIDFKEADCTLDEFVKDSEIALLIKQTYIKYGLDIQSHPKWVEMTSGIVWHTLNARLPDIAGGKLIGHFSLKELKNNEHFPEVEFMLNGEPKSKKELCNYFNKGFMDLMFVRESDGKKRYSILDWKSDRMEEADFAKPEILKKKVDDEYVVQRVLYSYCLIEWLKQFEKKRQGESDNDFSERLFQNHFGGIYYAFVRGCHEGTSNGIYAQTWDSYNTLRANYEQIKKLIYKEGRI